MLRPNGVPSAYLAAGTNLRTAVGDRIVNTAIHEIALTDDVSVIRSSQYLNRLISNSLTESGDDLLTSLSALPEYRKTVEPLIKHLQKNWTKNLSTADSIVLARWMLVTITKIPSAEPLVLHCLHEWPDDRQTVGKVVSYGLIGALWLAIASTEITYENGNLEIHKKAVVPEQVEGTAKALTIKFRLAEPPHNLPSNTLPADAKNSPKDTSIHLEKN